jgi:hypothetical protein
MINPVSCVGHQLPVRRNQSAGICIDTTTRQTLHQKGQNGLAERPQYAAANVRGVVTTSNHLDALYLAPDDRRHFVCVSTRTQDDFAPGYWDDINAWFENGGNEAVAHYLASLDLSTFNAKAAPPKTAAWHMVVATGVAPESSDLADMIEGMGKPDALTLQMVKVRAPER